MRLAENNMVYADERKGLAYIHRTKDGMVHFCWKERTSNRVEDDLIVFPQETIFKRITQCTTGRVYLLKFKDAKKLFLWMQEPKEEKDADICRTVNEVLNQGRVELVQNAQKDINMVEFTNLLGQLNDIGALNEIDLMEILGMTHEFDSRGTSESGASNIYGMNPFQIGSNYSIATFAERSGNTGIINDNSLPIKESSIPLKQSTRIDVSSINSQSTARLDPNEIFSETTLINLSRNKAFKSKVLCIENGQNGHEVDITSDEFKTRISNFGEILMKPVIARDLLNEMGVPDRIIVKLQNNDLAPLINDLEEYFGKKNTDER